MICIALPILVVIAGVYLLAKTKTDNLGTGFKLASYASIVAGLVILGISLMNCTSDNCCKKGGHHGHEYHQSCKGHDGCSGATCCKGGSKSCSKGDKCCKGESKSCSKGDKCCKGEGDKCCSKDAKSCSKTAKNGNTKCDMNECAKMTKEECAKNCDKLGCSAEEKEWCMSQYDETGKWVGSKTEKSCCKKEATTCSKSKKTCSKANDKVAQL